MVIIVKNLVSQSVPSVLWCCWLGGRKGIWPVKHWVVGAGMVICLERGTDLHRAQTMPVPFTVSCYSKIQIGFTFLVPARLGSRGKRAVKRVCVTLYTKQQWNQKYMQLPAWRPFHQSGGEWHKRWCWASTQWGQWFVLSSVLWHWWSSI